ncbi:MAG: PEGA domain-containing protein [Chitinispirillaceae bacterium]|nr:PEGA domain-containing protein [Chitinispirillaceae bacterium]
MPRRIVRFFSGILLLSTGVSASAFEEVSLAIIDFEGAGLEAGEIVMASDKFRATFVTTSPYRIIDPLLMIDTLKKQGVQQTDSGTSAANLMSAGKSLGVSYLLAGRFSRVNGITAISARIIDVKTGEILLAKSGEYQSKFLKFISDDIPAFVQDFTTALEKAIREFAGQHKQGILFIESNPENGQIAIDGVQTGKTMPATFQEIDTGAHDVQIRREGYKDGFFNVETKQGDTARLSVEYAPPPCRLTISTVPPRASIILNDSFKGRTPAIFNDMQPGHYSLMLTNRTHKPINRRFVLDPGATMAVQDTFKQLSGEYLEWQHRKARFRYLDITVAGAGRLRLKRDVPGFLFLGAGILSDAVVVYSTCRYYSHNQQSVHAASDSDLAHYEAKETDDLLRAVTAGTASLFLRFVSSMLTAKIHY